MIRRTIIVLLLLAAAGALQAAESLFTGDERVPADAVVLFDGKDLSGWTKAGSDEPAPWKLENGYMQVQGGSIQTRRQFNDFQLHLEFWLPYLPEAQGQGRANSGVYLQGSYEIQVLDSYGLQSGSGDCGGIYGVAAPLVNACRPPEHWQTYDIWFHAPTFDDNGNKLTNARVSVLHNGIWIHDSVEIPNATNGGIARDVKGPGPIMLQDHGSPIRYRNIWIRPL